MVLQWATCVGLPQRLSRVLCGYVAHQRRVLCGVRWTRHGLVKRQTMVARMPERCSSCCFAQATQVEHFSSCESPSADLGKCVPVVQHLAYETKDQIRGQRGKFLVPFSGSSLPVTRKTQPRVEVASCAIPGTTQSGMLLHVPTCLNATGFNSWDRDMSHRIVRIDQRWFS